ncbi:MAG: endonuclease VII domain-containing protein [Actinobacteria bacterium]|nr:endonuclease VII domain-containing protein [Actinomycetota bacterium]MCA1720242.1 endonuclease VII domain-containing protein [Actinomycetota bacterium]
MTTDKLCRDCGLEKPLEEFSPAKKAADGRTSYCRECLRVRHQRYRDARNGGAPTRRTRARASSPEHKWCPACQTEKLRTEFGSNRANGDGLTGYCKPCHNQAAKDTYTRLYGSTRNYHLKHRYGITAAEYDAMLAEQGGLCALCQERPAEHVDHDHLTNAVRGLLCSCCNQGLGNFRDRSDTLREAAGYLDRTTWQKRRISPGVYRLTPPRETASV